MASILPLQPNVIDAVRATIVIHSLEQCVNELVQNSLDARATSIEIKVDVSNFSLQVSDNGQGITRVNLSRLGTRYSTSKCQKLEDLDNISTYGFRGEALASIAEMSLLEITSKPRQQDRAYTVLFRGGDRLLLEESSKQLRYGYGTSVVVRDLFYKFPVRQRQVSQQSSLQDIEGVKRTVEKLALAAPHVNFVVIDAFRNVKVMSLRKADTLQSRIRALLGPSIASSLIAVHAVQESDGQDGGPSDIECTGLISTVGYFNQLHQHLFLNNRPIHSQAVHSAIHQLFQQSNFGKEKSSIDSDGRRVKERYPVYVLSLTCRSDWYDIFADPAKTTVLFKEEEQVVQLVRKMVARFLWEQHFMSRTMATSLLEQKYTGKKRKRPSNSTVTDVETDPEPQPGWDSHLHLPHVQPSRSLRIAPSSAVPFEGEDDWEGELIFELDSDWIHALTEDDFVPDDELEGSSSQNGAPAGMPRPPKPKLKRASLPPQPASKREINSQRLSALLAQDALRKWVNPVLPTAPISIPSIPLLKGLPSTTGLPMNMVKGSWGRILTTTQQQSGYFPSRSSHRLMGSGLESVVLTKEMLRHGKVIAQIDTKFILISLMLQAKSARPPDQPETESLLSQPLSTESPLSEPPRWIKVLVAIDQHAADERVRVEHMMRSFCRCCLLADIHAEAATPSVSPLLQPCQADSIAMHPPIKVKLTQREWQVANQFHERLLRWGIQLSSKDDQVSGAGQSHHGDDEEGGEGEKDENTLTQTVSRHFTLPATVDHQYHNSLNTLQQQDCVDGFITCLPRLIADRCAVDVGLAQDLIKETLAEMEVAPTSSIPAGRHRHKKADDDHDQDNTSDLATNHKVSQTWIQCMRGCPRAILDIIYSKACRGAIMFNDVLHLDECQNLVSELSKCAFPFQCAHGRPSAVPLAILDQMYVHPDGQGDMATGRDSEHTRREKRIREVKARTRGATQWKQWLLNSS